ncbi:sugar ABC transporter substrate-binding protein [Paenibacillus methanolicus]|uniref:D-xylose transport system substrate-binding protein n=1 Tax=Paenibacillus methanolicus TaxID=582686 RepID=A0A5S5C078_9BACL|nr:substrate-binding domain-containing protein [Paenibacillus methanolicus]TYP71852.1 D-xylose transport system substrate-binding protein [Paenibacillus methanolicus]
MKRVRPSVLMAGIALLMLTAGCSGAANTPSTDEQKQLIGLSIHNLIDERWQRDRDMFEGKASGLGADVVTVEAGGDEQKQLSQIDELLEQNIDVLVVVAQNTENMKSAVDKARAKGVKVLSYARLMKNADVDFYVSIDNVKAGEMQAEEILKLAPTGNYAYIGGGDTDNNAVLLRDGSMNVLKANSGITLVGDEYSKDWNPDEALKHMRAMLAKTGGNIQGVVAANDGTAGAAIQALAEYGLDGKVPVSGQDAELAALQRVAAGKQAMTIYLPIENMVTATVEAAVELSQGKEPAANNKVPNGLKDVPSNLLEPVIVTKANLKETVIDSGFAQLEDVYKDIPKDQWPAS